MEVRSIAWIEDTKHKIAIGLARTRSGLLELDRGEGVDGPTAMNHDLQQFQMAKQSIAP